MFTAESHIDFRTIVSNPFPESIPLHMSKHSLTHATIDISTLVVENSPYTQFSCNTQLSFIPKILSVLSTHKGLNHSKTLISRIISLFQQLFQKYQFVRQIIKVVRFISI